ncbi:hsp90 protein domain-containing protein [Phthorimaea operculella]|nr:hsp90 protein domain-containing protein [Phthorimaea operculella]
MGEEMMRMSEEVMRMGEEVMRMGEDGWFLTRITVFGRDNMKYFVLLGAGFLLLSGSLVAGAESEQGAPTVDADLGASREGSRTDAEALEREAEAVDPDALTAAQQREWLANAKNYTFQTEVNRMMKLIINSLYRNKEIFLRELISNGSDALDKIRLLSLTDRSALDVQPELVLRIKAEPDKRQLHIIDTGIGMTKNDLVNNLGTIAKSGTADFLSKMQDAESKNTQEMNDMIGQFGVGFYSAFLVAERVTVASKHVDDKQHVWESDASSFSVAEDPRGDTLKRGTHITSFSVAEDPRGDTLKRGTHITLHLKEEAADFLQADTIRKLVKKYSQFINFPIYLWASRTETLMNDNKPIWTRKPNEVSDDEYNQFYKTLTKDDKLPLAKAHFVAEGEVTFRALLFVPRVQPADSFNRYGTKSDNIKLYVRRVFITDEFNDLMPNYLGFIQVSDPTPTASTATGPRVITSNCTSDASSSPTSSTTSCPTTSASYRRVFITDEFNDLMPNYLGFIQVSDPTPTASTATGPRVITSNCTSDASSSPTSSTTSCPTTSASYSFNRYGTKSDNIKLYVRRVFITDEFNDLMPNYLGFIQVSDPTPTASTATGPRVITSNCTSDASSSPTSSTTSCPTTSASYRRVFITDEFNDLMPNYLGFKQVSDPTPTASTATGPRVTTSNCTCDESSSPTSSTTSCPTTSASYRRVFITDEFNDLMPNYLGFIQVSDPTPTASTATGPRVITSNYTCDECSSPTSSTTSCPTTSASYRRVFITDEFNDLMPNYLGFIQVSDPTPTASTATGPRVITSNCTCDESSSPTSSTTSCPTTSASYRRVFITDEFNDLMPNYLGFIQGIVDSDDLPLNVSRETLQQHKLIKIIKKKLVRKALDMLKKIPNDDYDAFWKEYSTNIKLGVMEDPSNRARLAKLIKFHSSRGEEQTFLADYVARMKPKQQHIYYIAGSSRAEVERSPFVERLVRAGYEVLYLTEAVDEYCLSALPEYDGHKFQNVAKEIFDLEEGEHAKETLEQQKKQFEPLTSWLGSKLGSWITRAQVSRRLARSPAALVATVFGWTGNMERLAMSNAHQKADDAQRKHHLSQKKMLEINPRHPLVQELLRRVQDDPDSPEALSAAHTLYRTAALRSGYLLQEGQAVELADTVEKISTPPRLQLKNSIKPDFSIKPALLSSHIEGRGRLD